MVLALALRDRTSEIAAQLAQSDPRVRLVGNLIGRTPNGLNAAISAARHQIIARVDGHGVLSPGYLRRAVEELQSTGAANVGGIMRAEGQTDFERAVARAMTTPFGIGRARFHLGGEAGPADTVYLGIFRREVIERLGGYDEHFARAQDWELNHRIRAAGETVWFTPDLEVTYRPAAVSAHWEDSSSGAENGAVRCSAGTPEPPVFGTSRTPVATVALAVGTAAGLGSKAARLGWRSVG